MKKITSLLSLLIILLLSSKGIAQSNISMVLKDDVSAENHFKTATVFNITFLGFTNKKEANDFIAELRNNKDVASCEQVFSDANGNGDVKLTMKKPQEMSYYLNLAKKMKVAYIQSGREKKSPEQWLTAGTQAK